MGQGVRFGRLFGVSIYVDLSWAFLCLLVAWNVSALLRSVHPDWGPGAVRLVSCAAAVLLLLAIATHELGHALIGRWLGLPAGSLRLFLFGDAAWGERTPASATAELLAAGAGPVLSVGIGFASLAALLSGVEPSSGYGPIFATLGPWQTLAAWWAFANVGVGVMNLLPAFPLDGGKVVRALLWRLTGDLGRATRAAASLAQIFAAALVGVGAAMALGFRVPLLGSGLVGGLWLTFLGWFVHVAAGRSMRGAVLGRLLDGVYVSTVMRPRFVQVPPDLALEVAVDRWLLRGEERALAVVEGDMFLGLVTMSDALKVEPRDWGRTPVADVMTSLFKLETVTPGEQLEVALDRLLARDVSQLPVFEDGLLVGMLCRADLARFLGVRPAGSAARPVVTPWRAARPRAALAMANRSTLRTPLPAPPTDPPPARPAVLPAAQPVGPAADDDVPSSGPGVPSSGPVLRVGAELLTVGALRPPPTPRLISGTVRRAEPVTSFAPSSGALLVASWPKGVTGPASPISGVVPCGRPAPSSAPSSAPGADADEAYAHEARPLPGMEEVLDRLSDDVRRAQERVWVGTYIYREGKIGHYFAGMFAYAARRGLDVRVLYDALGSQRMPRAFVDRMRAHGVDCRPFRPLAAALREGSPFPREHSRIVLFDDVGYVGGAAWSDEWLPRAWGGEGWREVCCRVRGPATRAMSAAFDHRWRVAGGETEGDYECVSAGPAQDVSFVTDTPRPPALLYDLHRERVRAARHRVWIANAYFCPPRGLEDDLREAAARGVDVRVITPGSSNDLRAIRLAAIARYGRWLEGGLRVFEYQPAMFHAKYALVDDDWATVGTFNLNSTSLRWVNEANFIVRQRPFVRQLASVFESDLMGCREVLPGDYRSHLAGHTLGRLYSAGLDAIDPSTERPRTAGALPWAR